MKKGKKNTGINKSTDKSTETESKKSNTSTCTDLKNDTY